MRKIFKKTLIILLIVMILFNFSVLENVSFASTFEEKVAGLLGSFVGIITWLFRLPAVAIAFVMNLLTADIAYMDGATAEALADSSFKMTTITPYEIFFNKVQLFDINFFDFNLDTNSAVYKIRSSVAMWFTILRLVAVSILLVILIYVGIRMALTTIADDKARYKQMLIDWITSLVLVFVLQFIIIFAVNVNNALVKAIGAAGAGAVSSGSAATGTDALSKAIEKIAKTALGVSTTALGATVVYCMIVWQTFGFVLAYINRTIKLAFLIIISPLISITYSIDKMGDGKSQALNAWLKEFVYTILMQPFHCIIYMTMVDLAFNLLINPVSSDGLAESILAILCIKFIKTAEELIRSIFSFQDDGKGSLAAGTAAAAVALNKSKDIGSTARKGVSFMKEAKVGEKLRTSATKTRAAARALRESKEDKEARKKTGAPKTSFAARMKREEANIEREREAKREEKANNKAYRLYNKHKDSYTQEDKQNIQNMARKIKKENPGMTTQEALKQARTKVSREKIASGAYQNKVIRGYKKVKKAVSNSATYQFAKNVVIPVGFGLGIGSMGFGGDMDAFSAGMLGTAAGKSMGEFMKSSTSTLVGDISEQLKAKGTSPADAEEEVVGIKLRGDNGGFDEDALKDITKALTAAFGAINANKVKDSIDSKFRNGECDFDLEKLLKEKVGGDFSQEQIDTANSFKNFRHDSSIYKTLGNAENAGISAETLAKKTSEDMSLDYDEYEFLEDAKGKELSEVEIKRAVYNGKTKKKDGESTPKNEHDLGYIQKELEDEIKKVDKQLQELETQLSKIPLAETENRANMERNKEKLKSSRKMLEENAKQVEKYKKNIESGGTF